MIRIKQIALKFPYISVNPPKLKLWLPFDIDKEGGGLAWENAGLAMPNVSIVNRVNGHAHLLYGLDAPVATSQLARIGPLRYLAAIERAYLSKLMPYGADAGFSGLMVKNPQNTSWRAFWGRLAYWSLDEMSQYVDLSKHKLKNISDRKVEFTGVNRNVTLFNFLGPEGKWSYSAIWGYRGERFEVWNEAVLQKALEMNGEFPMPLPYSEVKSIAKSIAKWVWQHDKHWHQKFLDRQSFKGKKSGKARLLASENKRVTARLMKARGLTIRQIADELGIAKSNIGRWVA